MQTNFKPYANEITSNLLNSRKQIFKDVLIEYTNQQHVNFLQEKQIKQFDAIKYNTWHSEFDLNNLEDVPKFRMEAKPRAPALRIR